MEQILQYVFLTAIVCSLVTIIIAVTVITVKELINIYKQSKK